MAQPDCLLRSLDRSNDATHDSTTQSLERFRTNLLRLHDRYAHSEPRVLFFLNKGVNSIPPYWDFHIESLINEGIARLQDLVSINHELFSPTNLDTTLQKFHHELLSASVRIDITDKLSTFQELHKQERKKDLERAKQEAVRTLRYLKDALDILTTNQFNNPLKLDLSDPFDFRDKALSILRKLEELLHRPSYKRMEDLEADAKNLKELKAILLFQASENDDEDWRFDLVQFLRSLQPNEKVTDLVFHLHSLHDICEDCAPTLAREWERSDGFLMRFKSWVMAYNGNINEAPSVHLLTSCSNIRKVAADRHSSHGFNHPTIRPVFTQIYMPPPAESLGAVSVSTASVVKKDDLKK